MLRVESHVEQMPARQLDAAQGRGFVFPRVCRCEKSDGGGGPLPFITVEEQIPFLGLFFQTSLWPSRTESDGHSDPP
jgi:hypothetical protein